MLSTLQQSSPLPSCAFHCYHQTHWPPLFCCLFPSNLLSQLSLTSHPIYGAPTFCIRKAPVEVSQLIPPSAQLSPRQAMWKVCVQQIRVSKKWLELLCICKVPLWGLVPPGTFWNALHSPAPVLPPARCSPVRVSFSPWLLSTWDWTSGGPCLGPSPTPSQSSLPGSLCWLLFLSLFPEGPCCRAGCIGGGEKGFFICPWFCRVSHTAGNHFLLQCATSSSHSHNFYLVFPCQHWRLNISSGSWPCVPAHIWQRLAFHGSFTQPMLFTNLAAEESHFSPSKLYSFLKEQQTHCQFAVQRAMLQFSFECLGSTLPLARKKSHAKNLFRRCWFLSNDLFGNTVFFWGKQYF